MDKMETPERAHLSESLPTGSLAVLRARKMVFPVGHSGLASWKGWQGLRINYTRLHTHEDAPGIVGCRIDESGEKKTQQ